MSPPMVVDVLVPNQTGAIVSGSDHDILASVSIQIYEE